MPDDQTKATKRAAKRSAAGTLAITMARHLTKALAESLAPLGLAPAQYAVLRELWRKEAHTQAELAQMLDVEQATMSNTLKRMLRDGLIRYEADRIDARARRVFLSEQGAVLREPAEAVLKKIQDRAFGGLTRKEQKRFVELTSRVIASLKDEGSVERGAS